MKTLIRLLTAIILACTALIGSAQESSKQPNPILKNLLRQDSLRMNNRTHLGVGVVSFTGGYAIKPRITLNATVHPRNNFVQGDPIGLGFGSGTGGSDWQNGHVYGQTNVAGYENMDAATVLLGGRYFVVSSLFVSAGIAAQLGSWRQVDFAPDTRSINGTTYEDLGIGVRTNLKNQYAPYFGFGFHHQVGRFGLFADVAFSSFNKRLKSADVSTTQALTPADLEHFQRKVKSGAESEGFGIMTYGVTVAF